MLLINEFSMIFNKLNINTKNVLKQLFQMEFLNFEPDWLEGIV